MHSALAATAHPQPLGSSSFKTARIKKAIPGKDGFVGLREDCASGLWVKHISTWGKNGQK